MPHRLEYKQGSADGAKKPWQVTTMRHLPKSISSPSSNSASTSRPTRSFSPLRAIILILSSRFASGSAVRLHVCEIVATRNTCAATSKPNEIASHAHPTLTREVARVDSQRKCCVQGSWHKDAEGVGHAVDNLCSHGEHDYERVAGIVEGVGGGVDAATEWAAGVSKPKLCQVAGARPSQSPWG